jgi:4-hydroxy-3-polyprenylbenzoate decarboxylase
VNQAANNLPLVLAMTGASGAPYAMRLLEALLAAGRQVHLSISASGQSVLKQELGLKVDLSPSGMYESLKRYGQTKHRGDSIAKVLDAADGDRLICHHYQDFMAPIASGSFLTAGMAICPCSGSTLSAIACGGSNNLIQRAADVHLKERRKLILVPRETPLSVIQLDNMKRCAEAGAVILPAMPGFYHGARTIDDLVDFVVARICDQLGISNELMHRWGDVTKQ